MSSIDPFITEPARRRPQLASAPARLAPPTPAQATSRIHVEGRLTPFLASTQAAGHPVDVFERTEPPRDVPQVRSALHFSQGARLGSYKASPPSSLEAAMSAMAIERPAPVDFAYFDEARPLPGPSRRRPLGFSYLLERSPSRGQAPAERPSDTSGDAVLPKNIGDSTSKQPVRSSRPESATSFRQVPAAAIADSADEETPKAAKSTSPNDLEFESLLFPWSSDTGSSSSTSPKDKSATPKETEREGRPRVRRDPRKAKRAQPMLVQLGGKSNVPHKQFRNLTPAQLSPKSFTEAVIQRMAKLKEPKPRYNFERVQPQSRDVSEERGRGREVRRRDGRSPTPSPLIEYRNPLNHQRAQAPAQRDGSRD